MDLALMALLAYTIDCVIGDPYTKYHPVALMGKLIDILDKSLRRDEAQNSAKFAAGLVLVLIVSGVCAGAAYLIVELMNVCEAPRWAVIAVQAAILSFMISPKSLAKAGNEVYDELSGNNLAGAREKINYIVSRDANQMDEKDIARAAVETVAENIVDGIISPFFFFFLGGLPLAVLYRAANTMDAMIGYKNSRYLYFGRAAARFDDALNYIPARITGILLVLSAKLCGFDYKNAWKMMRRDAGKHPSPNGGYTEATVAGALKIRLGGVNYYFGRQTFRAFMGDPVKELKAIHIRQTIRLMYSVSTIFVVAASIIAAAAEALK